MAQGEQRLLSYFNIDRDIPLTVAISAFQYLNQLPPTGAIDQQTMAALNSSSSSGSSGMGTGAVPGAGGISNPDSPATR